MHRRMGIEALTGIGGGSVSRESQEAFERAEELCFAGEPERAIPFLRKAMKDPNNLDACIQAASILPAKEGIAIVESAERQGRELLKRSLGPTCFEDDNVGHFWGILETRPYMRILASMVELYFEEKEYNKAANVAIEMLRLCPADNMAQRDVLGSLLLQAGRNSEALYFAQVWLKNSLGDGSPPLLGGCDFQAPSSEPMDDKLFQELYRWPSDAMTHTGALAAFKLYGDCTLARQYLRLGAKANSTILIRILAKINQPKMPNSGARTLNGSDSAHDYLWMTQNLWMKPDVWNWANSDEETMKIILRKCCAPDCSNIETRPNEYKRCAACKMTWYCGTPCQKKHWPEHRIQCKQWKQSQALIASVTTGRPFS